MTERHRRCDLLLGAAGQALASGEWAAFRTRILELRGALLAELELDTELRELAAEHSLRHRRMREILDVLAAASPAHDPEGCGAELATLGLLYREHKAVQAPVVSPAREATVAQPASTAPALDLRGLEPPQPILRIFDALERAPGEPLRVVLPHEPQPLYGLLRQHGFEWSGAPRADGGFDLTIRKGC